MRKLVINEKKEIGKGRWRVLDDEVDGWSRTLDEVVETIRASEIPLTENLLCSYRNAWRKSHPNSQNRNVKVPPAQTHDDLIAGAEVGALRCINGKWHVEPSVVGIPESSVNPGE